MQRSPTRTIPLAEMLLHIPTKKKTSYLHEKRKRIVNSTVRDK